jgi:hypothetical protein
MARWVSVLLTSFLLLSPLSARAEWALNGNPVSVAANSENFASAVPDGSFGAFILWEDYRTGSSSDLYLQRINVYGLPLWPANGIPVSTAVLNQKYPVMIADGAGGVIVAWDDDRASMFNKDIYAQRVNGAGVVQWTSNGVALCTAANHQQYPHIVSDGAGGAIVSWTDDRALVNSNHTYAQRINATGSPQWTADGVAIQTATSGGEQNMISDSAGGAIVAFMGGTGDVSVQRLNATGVVQWTTNGVSLCVAANAQWYIQIVTDGAGGAIVGWSDARTGTHDIYARRVTAAGVPQWTANGVALCTAANDQFLTAMTAGASGSAITAWEDRRNGNSATYYDIYTQRVTSSGTASWSPNGVAVCSAANHQIFPQMVSDGTGGAIIAWPDFRTAPAGMLSSSDTYAQRVSNTGAMLWTANGVPVSLPGNPGLQTVTSNGLGGAIVAWKDDRDVFAFDIYAQRIESRYGYWGRPEGWITSVNDVPGDQGGHVMVRWDASDRDVFPTQEISHYTLWRELGQSAVPSLAASSTGDARLVDPSTIGPEFAGKAYRQVSTAAGTTSWEFIATIPIRYATEYGFNTSTLGDSVASDAADATYQVLAHTTNAFVYYEGNLFTGHSVDNVAPAAPLALTAQRVGANVNLTWNRVHVSDLKNYSAYRSTSTGVTPVPQNFLANSNDTVLVDAGAPTTSLYYVVTANDVHANEGPASNQAAVSPLTGAGDLPPIASFMVLQNHPNPFTGTTVFQVGLPATSDISLEVYDVGGRRVRATSLRQLAGWQHVSFDGRNDAGRLLASGVYFCRMSALGTTITHKIVITR